MHISTQHTRDVRKRSYAVERLVLKWSVIYLFNLTEYTKLFI